MRKNHADKDTKTAPFITVIYETLSRQKGAGSTHCKTVVSQLYTRGFRVPLQYFLSFYTESISISIVSMVHN